MPMLKHHSKKSGSIHPVKYHCWKSGWKLLPAKSLNDFHGVHVLHIPSKKEIKATEKFVVPSSKTTSFQRKAEELGPKHTTGTS